MSDKSAPGFPVAEHFSSDGPAQSTHRSTASIASFAALISEERGGTSQPRGLNLDFFEVLARACARDQL